MRKLIGILIAIALVLVGVGVVRPHTLRLMHESWEPVVQQRVQVSLGGQDWFELTQLGDYVVFLEGPPKDPLWESGNLPWVQILNGQTHQPVPGNREGVDFAYEFDGKRARSIARVSISQAGDYEASFGSAEVVGLRDRGFVLTLCPAKLVVEQSRKSTTWMIGGIALGIVMGIFGLSSLMGSSD